MASQVSITRPRDVHANTRLPLSVMVTHCLISFWYIYLQVRPFYTHPPLAVCPSISLLSLFHFSRSWTLLFRFHPSNLFFEHLESDDRTRLRFQVIIMLTLSLIVAALLTTTHASNDWSQPCTTGSCSYDVASDINTTPASVSLVSVHWYTTFLTHPSIEWVKPDPFR